MIIPRTKSVSLLDDIPPDSLLLKAMLAMLVNTCPSAERSWIHNVSMWSVSVSTLQDSSSCNLEQAAIRTRDP